MIKKKPVRDGHWAKHKEERFNALSPKRLDNALEAIKSLGNLGNRLNYKYDQNQAKALLGQMEAAMEELRQKFEPKSMGRPVS